MTPEGLKELEGDEGRSNAAYPDPESALGKACEARGLKMAAYKRVPNWQSLGGAPWTIAYGYTGPDVHEGTVWTDAQVEASLPKRVAGFEAEVREHLPWSATLDPVRFDVLTMLAYNLGIDGLLKWPHTLAAVKAADYQGAHDQILSNKVWCGQVGAGRSVRMANAMRTGKWAA